MINKIEFGIIAAAALFLMCTGMNSYADTTVVTTTNTSATPTTTIATTTTTTNSVPAATPSINVGGNSAIGTYYLQPTPATKATPKPASNGTFIFDPRARRWYAYDASGKLVRSGRASGGRNYCPDIHSRCHTPVGRFVVYSKGGPGCKSKKFPIHHPGAPMPYCMFFHGGFAIHGSNEVPNYNASHGCIRVPPSEAYWLSHNFIHTGTVVIVTPY